MVAHGASRGIPGGIKPSPGRGDRFFRPSGAQYACGSIPTIPTYAVGYRLTALYAYELSVRIHPFIEFTSSRLVVL